MKTSGLQYEIHITEDGKDTVSVSLEWTKEAPKVAGVYFAVWVTDRDAQFKSCVCVVEDENRPGDLRAYDLTTQRYADMFEFNRWLGPIPTPTA